MVALLTEELKPQEMTEVNLVSYMAMIRIRLNRFDRAENALLFIEQDKIKQTDGYILRSFKCDLGVREILDPAALNKILKALQRKAKMKDIGQLSGHSFHVGAAVDLLDKGVPLERIMLRGGWKSENTALRYLKNWDDSDWLIVGEA